MRAEPSHWLHEILHVPKLFITIFGLGQYPHYKTGGTYLLNSSWVLSQLFFGGGGGQELILIGPSSIYLGTLDTPQ
jgi:hypothetical protein